MTTAPADGLFWQLQSTNFPEPLSRWGARLMALGSTDAVAALAAEYGLLVDGIEYREIGGRVYNALVPLGGKVRKPPPGWLVAVLVRVHPDLRRRVRTQREALANRRLAAVIDDWVSSGEAALLARGRAELARDLDLADDALADEVDRTWDYALEALAVHYRLHAAAIVEIGHLGLELTRDHGFGTAELAGLLTGLSVATTGPGRAQQQIVDLALAAGGADALATAVDLDAVRAISCEVADALDAYLRTWAPRAVKYDPAHPTVIERPDWLLKLLRDQARAPLDHPRTDAHEATRAEIGRRVLDALGDNAEVLDRIARARAAFPVREGNETATIGLPIAALRRVGLEIGERLAARGRLEDRADVFDLEPAEARGALLDDPNAPADAAALARQRRRARLAVPGDPPATIGEPMPPPDLSGFPADVATNVEATLWYTDAILAQEPTPVGHTFSHRTDAIASGIAVSSGRYEGVARVVLDESGFERIEHGDVLVCPMTAPVWSMVFPLLGALVCDAGGPLSHPAIIAREFAIPAVVGAGTATTTIPDGARIVVDGDDGTVTAVDA